MNSLTRGLVVILFSLGLLGVSGCSADNETEAQKLSKGMGDPGKGAVTTGKPDEDQPPPKTRQGTSSGKPIPERQMGSNYPAWSK